MTQSSLKVLSSITTRTLTGCTRRYLNTMIFTHLNFLVSLTINSIEEVVREQVVFPAGNVMNSMGGLMAFSDQSGANGVGENLY